MVKLHPALGMVADTGRAQGTPSGWLMPVQYERTARAAGNALTSPKERTFNIALTRLFRFVPSPSERVRERWEVIAKKIPLVLARGILILSS
ncbi:hypothetical protein C8P68_105207 [Mucilaginibacter yixingensis]|uniref:Uncharacterized protein n=1 Tax=Mucilaginibacter yixingensis TaxID=1295612 RepID=A0A2T5J8I1_9SPHI|nr:hypothetical protein C8P68_105207 [Mucilaginibacter yixingensis]